MPNIVSTTTPQKNTVKAMQIKALEQRRKDAELAAAKATQPQVVDSPWQGAANMANAFFTARRSSNLANQEQATRDALAKLRSGWGPEGPNMAQIQEAAQYDEELANKLQSELQDRNYRTAEREDEQSHRTSERIGGQEFTKQQNESQQAFELRKEEARQKFERGERIEGQNWQSGEKAEDRSFAHNERIGGQEYTIGRDETLHDFDMRKEKARQDFEAAEAKKLADAKLAEPPAVQSVPQAVAAYEAGKYGPVGSKEAMMLRDAEIAKITNIPGPTTRSVTVMTENGPVTVEDSTGGRGSGTGTTTGGAPNIGTYQAEGKVASDALANIADVEKALKNPGYTGPGGSVVGMAADAADALTGALGWTDTQKTIRDTMGDPASRKIISADSVKTILNNVSALKGAISNKENDLLAKLGTSLENHPNANAIMIGVARRMAENAQLRSNMASEYFAKNGTLNGFEEGVWSPYIDSHPTLQYNEQTGAIELAGAGGAPAPTQPAPTQPAPTAQPPLSPKPPQPGDTDEGFIFQGGDPGDKRNWVRP